MTWPTFIGIGAQRAGTTWLYHCLAEHPQVFVSPTKELQFFNNHYDEGTGWYAAHFRDVGEERAIGEVSPNYLETAEAPQRIRQLLPDVRLFVSLRDPVSRALSAYNLFKDQRYAGVSFEQACGEGSPLVYDGLYALHLRRWFEHFDRDQLLVLIYDDIERHPQAVVQRLYEHIGVDADFVPPSISLRYNRAGGGYRRLQSIVKRLGLAPVARLAKQTPLGRVVRRSSGQTATAKTEQLDEDFMQSLRGRFRDDILKLQEMIGRDLSAWL